ncbi:DUF1176 domain-containing protein [Paraburkholderia acidipaludis]|uniref:DUF1176 domain-containing protein n=1 Tax=Paraburkholderia acidipaludis TaxID=660537 RepID=UPI0004855B3F|nr:DUF1176 domain-containing protein [Paraburkholderia acidipaludis]
MIAFCRLLILIALAGVSTVATAAAKGASSGRDFKGWEVVCDNVKRCAAIGADEDNTRLVVWLWRDAGPDGAMKLQVAADKPLRADQMRLDGHAFRFDPSKAKAWQDKTAQTYAYRLATEDPATISAWIEAAHDAHMMSFGDPAASGTPGVSLAGLSAALLAIDDMQGRVGTVTAWRRAGAAPASSVPAANPLPVVKAAPPVPDLSAAEQHRLIDATYASVHADVEQCDADNGATDDTKGLHDGSRAVALSASEALVSLACGDTSAYNDVSLWYRVRRAPPFAAKPLALPGNTGTGDDGDSVPRNQLTGAFYNTSEGGLISFDRARSMGDCGDSTTWAFDGTNFVLASDRFEGACIGLLMNDWPSVYRTKTQ